MSLISRHIQFVLIYTLAKRIRQICEDVNNCLFQGVGNRFIILFSLLLCVRKFS